MNTLLLRLAVKGQTSTSAAKSSMAAALPTTRRGRVEVALGALLGWMGLAVTSAFAAADGEAQENTVEFIKRITDFGVLIVASFAILMGVWAALQFVGAGGNSSVAGKAKNTIKNVVIGLAVCAGIYIIKNVVLNIVGGIDGADGNTKDVVDSLGE